MKYFLRSCAYNSLVISSRLVVLHLHNKVYSTRRERSFTLCLFSRLEWEAAVLRGVNTFQSLEEERLNNLKSVLTSYLHHSNDLGPRLIEVSVLTVTLPMHFLQREYFFNNLILDATCY